ncbi:MAG: YihA family ribosome biogenesis GTP-binding protein [Clostridia bacterium]|nr:YihA family ribosome biogenesis GTP-binding protein [Clostridia bacterium]
MLNYNKIEFETSFGAISQLKFSTMPEIVFSGRSNVGKSSLINTLFARKNLARVSAEPGKTVTINFYKCGNVRFVDLPGYGFAKRSDAEKRRWGQLMEYYFDSDREIALVVQLIDSRHPMSAEDAEMINYMEDRGIPYIIALTKVDKMKPTERKTRMAEIKEEFAAIDDIPMIPFSSRTGEGMRELKAEIEKYI